MPKPPAISGREAVRVFEKAGSLYTLSIPLHDALGPGLLRDQIRKAGLTIDEFISLL